MKKYTPIENAFYWAVTTIIVTIGIALMVVLYALVESITPCTIC